MHIKDYPPHTLITRQSHNRITIQRLNRRLAPRLAVRKPPQVHVAQVGQQLSGVEHVGVRALGQQGVAQVEDLEGGVAAHEGGEVGRGHGHAREREQPQVGQRQRRRQRPRRRAVQPRRQEPPVDEQLPQVRQVVERRCQPRRGEEEGWER